MHLNVLVAVVSAMLTLVPETSMTPIRNGLWWIVGIHSQDQDMWIMWSSGLAVTVTEHGLMIGHSK